MPIKTIRIEDFREITSELMESKSLKEFETKGFVPFYDKTFLSVLRKYHGDHYRIFKTIHRGKKKKNKNRFGPYEIFGKRLFYYYDVRRKDEFVEFLTKLFYEKNPEPDIGAKSTFTRMLKYHGLK